VEIERRFPISDIALQYLAGGAALNHSSFGR
jgi:hypothetical protein